MVQPFLDKKRKGDLIVQPGISPSIYATRLKGNIPHPACIQDRVFLGKSKKRKRHVTIV